jgi:hypothetical protein
MRKIDLTVISLVLISLTACSGLPATVQIEPEAPDIVNGENAVVFPPTWTPTLIPTETQISETATPIATEDPGSSVPASPELPDATAVVPTSSTSGWQLVEGATASFYLPGSFEVLDLGSEFGLLMAALMTGMMEGMVEMTNELGQEFGADPITPTPMDLSELESAFQIDFVLAMQADEKTSAFLFSEPLETSTSLEEQMQSTLEEQSNTLEIISMARIVDSEYETGRMDLLVTDSETGEQGHVLIYIILLTERVYQLGYTTTIERYRELLPIFDASASTFSVYP